MSSTGLWALEELLLEEKRRPSMNIRISEWMNEWIGFTVIPHHLQCTQCVYRADCVCLSPLSECTQSGLWVSSQRESRNWACECAKGPGLEIKKKPGFLSQTCYNPVVWTWKFLSSSWAFTYSSVEWGVGGCPRTFPSYTFTFLAQNGSTALQAPESPWCSETKPGKKK